MPFTLIYKPNSSWIALKQLSPVMIKWLALLLLIPLIGCAPTVPVVITKIEKVKPDDSLLVNVEKPVVPDCKTDSCVASFIVKEEQALAICASRLDAIRLWSSK